MVRVLVLFLVLEHGILGHKEHGKSLVLAREHTYVVFSSTEHDKCLQKVLVCTSMTFLARGLVPNQNGLLHNTSKQSARFADRYVDIRCVGDRDEAIRTRRGSRAAIFGYGSRPIYRFQRGTT